MNVGNGISSSYVDCALPSDVNELVMMNLIEALREPSTSSRQVPEHHPTVRNPLVYINPAVVSQTGQLPPLLGGCIQNPSNEDNYKTAMCETWLARGYCHYGEHCNFAHGEHEKRRIKPMPRNPRKYKTQPCLKYTAGGICPYGEDCFYIHPDLNGPYNHRLQFSASVPVGTFSEGLWNAAQDELVAPEFISALKFAMGHQDLADRKDHATSPPTSEPAFSNSDNSASSSLKQQVIEQLRKKNDITFLPSEERHSVIDDVDGSFKSEYRMFDMPDFSKSFSGVLNR